MALTSSAQYCVCCEETKCSSNCVLASCVEMYVLTRCCTPTEWRSSHTCKYYHRARNCQRLSSEVVICVTITVTPVVMPWRGMNIPKEFGASCLSGRMAVHTALSSDALVIVIYSRACS